MLFPNGKLERWSLEDHERDYHLQRILLANKKLNLNLLMDTRTNVPFCRIDRAAATKMNTSSSFEMKL